MFSKTFLLVIFCIDGMYSKTRIIGGFQAVIDNYGYTVSLQFDDEHICGGAIVTPTMVTSGAHCIRYPKETYSVRVGSTYKDSGGRLYNTSKIIIHPEYNRRTADKDICLLFFKESLLFDWTVRMIALPDEDSKVRIGTTAVVTGWGSTKLNDPYSVSPTLKGVYVDVVSFAKCKALYPPNSITNSMICAGSRKPEDACSGDSGGPMVANGLLIGLVSWAFSCADVNYPGIYTSVSSVVDFIENNTNAMSRTQ
ncbi:PREDICTED: trypsin-7-like [Nicrophorus vespilloides]|uniref:Trypsin-7-like n=1 Tax=Nicrophorus vespilloides TaxID=110193 RepID=A0ABM1MBK7_NICVS|nr:PREDICTED: trypsin-7-like [Nicrophorus vespilloides]